MPPQLNNANAFLSPKGFLGSCLRLILIVLSTTIVVTGCTTTEVTEQHHVKGEKLDTREQAPTVTSRDTLIRVSDNQVKVSETVNYEQRIELIYQTVLKEDLRKTTKKVDPVGVVLFPACVPGLVLFFTNPFDCLFTGEFEWSVDMEERRTPLEGRTMSETKMREFDKTHPAPDANVVLALNGKTLGSIQTDSEGKARFSVAEYIQSENLHPRTYFGGTPMLTASYDGAAAQIPLSPDFRESLPDGYLERRQQQMDDSLRKRNLLLHDFCHQRAEAARDYFSCYFSENRIATAFGSGVHHGPVDSNGNPAGTTLITLSEERTFIGKAERDAESTILRGKLHYEDGREFIGNISEKTSQGTLLSENGEVIFSGPFEDGEPDGWGVKEDSRGEVVPAKYVNGDEVSDPIRKEVRRSIEASRSSNVAAPIPASDLPDGTAQCFVKGYANDRGQERDQIIHTNFASFIVLNSDCPRADFFPTENEAWHQRADEVARDFLINEFPYLRGRVITKGLQSSDSNCSCAFYSNDTDPWTPAEAKRSLAEEWEEYVEREHKRFDFKIVKLDGFELPFERVALGDEELRQEMLDKYKRIQSRHRKEKQRRIARETRERKRKIARKKKLCEAELSDGNDISCTCMPYASESFREDINSCYK